MANNFPRRQFDSDGIPILTAPGPESKAAIKRQIEKLGYELTAQWPLGGYCYTAEHRAWAQKKIAELQEQLKVAA